MRRKARAMEVVTVKLDPDEQPDTEVNLVELAVGHWLYWCHSTLATTLRDTFQLWAW